MSSAQGGRRAHPFRYCLNTSTIRRPGLTAMDALDIAARAGYEGVEPWTRELDAHVAAGGSLEQYRERAQELGLKVVNLIAFFEWAVDDDELRARGLQEARRSMKMCRAVGCRMLAAPPFGATDIKDLDLDKVASRYRDVLNIAAEYGVKPMVEFWWMSKKLKRLSEAAFVAMQSEHHGASVLTDIFHMYRGGSPWEGLRLLSPKALGLVHINDYPTSYPRESLVDADRVYPGDGGAPLTRVLRDLYEMGYRGYLSLELFNEEHLKKDALDVAREGLAKMQASVEEALVDPDSESAGPPRKRGG